MRAIQCNNTNNNSVHKEMHGTFVTLRSLIPEDSEHYFRCINDKSLVLHNGNYKPVSMTEHEQWFNQITLKSNVVTFSIVENQNNTLIGSCSLRNINTVHHHAELQIRIGEINYQNRGYGSEAVQLLVQYGFQNLMLKRIYLYVFCSNTRAVRAYEKCNFNVEGVLKKAACINGEYIDLKLMAVINQ